MNRGFTLMIALLLAALLRPAAATAQESNFVPDASANVHAPAGWSFTPSLAYSGSWDDNVLLRGKGDETPADFLSVVNPRGAVDFNGRLGQMSASYDGAFALYRDLGSLNSYDQHGAFFGRRLVSPHVALFVRNTAASVPTTELSQLIAVPFLRTGSKLDDLHGGVEAAFSKRTSMTASYDFQWVAFDRAQPGSDGLRGGHSNGASLSLKHLQTARFALIADYDLQHAIIGSLGEAFDIQHAWGGAEYKLSDVTRAFVMAGISRLDITRLSQSRTGPAWRLGLLRQLRTADVDVLYTRSFVPAYGFGGTMQNEEITGRFRVPLGRRFYSNSELSWRSNDPLIAGDLPLRSYWIEGTLGFAATPMVRIEAFYAGTHQTINRPGGQMARNRVGFQVITAKPVRIR
jgi:hypothetical protein